MLFLLARLGHTFDVIGGSDSWINERSHGYSQPGQVNINRNRLGKTGGEVFLFVDSLHSVNICDDFIISNGHSDSLFIEINVNNGKKNSP